MQNKKSFIKANFINALAVPPSGLNKIIPTKIPKQKHVLMHDRSVPVLNIFSGTLGNSSLMTSSILK